VDIALEVAGCFEDCGIQKYAIDSSSGFDLYTIDFRCMIRCQTLNCFAYGKHNQSALDYYSPVKMIEMLKLIDNQKYFVSHRSPTKCLYLQKRKYMSAKELKRGQENSS
jgi:hypothetical protein